MEGCSKRSKWGFVLIICQGMYHLDMKTADDTLAWNEMVDNNKNNKQQCKHLLFSIFASTCQLDSSKAGKDPKLNPIQFVFVFWQADNTEIEFNMCGSTMVMWMPFAMPYPLTRSQALGGDLLFRDHTRRFRPCHFLISPSKSHVNFSRNKKPTSLCRGKPYSCWHFAFSFCY